MEAAPVTGWDRVAWPWKEGEPGTCGYSSFARPGMLPLETSAGQRPSPVLQTGSRDRKGHSQWAAVGPHSLAPWATAQCRPELSHWSPFSDLWVPRKMISLIS